MNPTFVAIVDYRSGNLASLVQAFKCIGVHSEIISSPSHFYLKPFTHLVLPGVGSFDLCRERLSTSSFDNFLLTIAAAGIIPILGICVGMQLLASSSAEGSLSGLSLIPGKVQSLSKLNSPFLPHLGWNVALPLTANIFPSLSSNKYFYFIHSYFFDTDTEFIVASTPITSTSAFPSIVSSGIVFGCQFHPEKSHHNGLRLLQSFVNTSC